MKKKIKIIDEICKMHPSYGVEKGWSEYTGGMKDSGSWFFRKMLDFPEKELQSFLDDIITQENTPIKPLTEQEKADCKIIHNLPNGGFINEFEKKSLERFYKNAERLLFGFKP